MSDQRQPIDTIVELVETLSQHDHTSRLQS